MSARGHLRVIYGSDADREAHDERLARARAGMRTRFAVAPGSSLRTLDDTTIQGRDDGSAAVTPEQFGPDGLGYLRHLVARGLVLELDEVELSHRAAAPTGYRVGSRALLIGGDSLTPNTPINPNHLPAESLKRLIDRGLVIVDPPEPPAAA